MITIIAWSFVSLCVGVWLGRYFQMWLVKKAIEHLADQMYDQAVEDYNKNIEVVNVVIEKEGEMWFVYKEDTKEFLGQGKSPEQVNAALRQRFPNTFFTAAFDNIEQTGYINSERL